MDIASIAADSTSPVDIARYVFDALIKQEHPAMNETGEACAYRGTSDTRCAAGHLIADDKYRPGIEGTPAISAFATIYGNDMVRGLPERTRAMLTFLQQVHDNIAGEEYSFHRDSLRDFTVHVFNNSHDRPSYEACCTVLDEYDLAAV